MGSKKNLFRRGGPKPEKKKKTNALFFVIVSLQANIRNNFFDQKSP